jgi:hypothetical protein
MGGSADSTGKCLPGAHAYESKVPRRIGLTIMIGCGRIKAPDDSRPGDGGEYGEAQLEGVAVVAALDGHLQRQLAPAQRAQRRLTHDKIGRGCRWLWWCWRGSC